MRQCLAFMYGRVELMSSFVEKITPSFIVAASVLIVGVIGWAYTIKGEVYVLASDAKEHKSAVQGVGGHPTTDIRINTLETHMGYIKDSLGKITTGIETLEQRTRHLPNAHPRANRNE